MSFRSRLKLSLLFFVLVYIGLNSVNGKTLSLKQQLGQKIMLDLRYYCPEPAPKNKDCLSPLTELPNELAEFIAQHNIGGVILFAENLQTIEQTVRLTHDLQQAGLKSTTGTPLFIAVDQEGGRVARLPRQHSTALSGNMAIAAIYANEPELGRKYARLAGEVLGAELQATGFNLNFAPNVDVNVNPDNPVINIRSFGDKAHIVAELAATQLKSMQQQGIIGSLKHFPGHGDTHVDSHTGLPKVAHSLRQIEQVDLLPFQQIIQQGQVDMIMTAHIQYPHLDSSTFVSKSGKTMIKPATMSSTILQGLLRHKLKFDGVIISDAMDMRGISDFFTPEQAVIEAFKAGVDIALMPLKIQSPVDFGQYEKMISTVAAAVARGEIPQSSVRASRVRIQTLKAKYQLSSIPAVGLAEQIVQAENQLASPRHKWIEKQISELSITTMKGTGQLAKSVNTLHVLMPDANKCKAFTLAIAKLKHQLKTSCDSILETTLTSQKKKINQADAFLVASLMPQQSRLEMGDNAQLAEFSQLLNKVRQEYGSYAKLESHYIAQLLAFSQQQQKQKLLVYLRMPHKLNLYKGLVDDLIATFSYNQYNTDNNRVEGVTYSTLAKLLTAKIKAQGRLPLTLEQQALNIQKKF